MTYSGTFHMAILQMLSMYAKITQTIAGLQQNDITDGQHQTDTH